MVTFLGLCIALVHASVPVANAVFPSRSPLRYAAQPIKSDAPPIRAHQDIATMLQSVVASGRHAPQRWSRLDDVAPDLHKLYESASWGVMWSRGGQPTASARAVIDQLATIGARGLDPLDYDVARLQTLSAESADQLETSKAQVDFDITLSTAVLRAVRALHSGRVSPTSLHASLHFARPPYDVVNVVRAMQSASNPSVHFDDAEPPYTHYHALKRVLARYRLLAADSALRRVALNELGTLGTLRPDASGDAVPGLRRLLSAFGDLESSPTVVPAQDSTRYDSVLVEAVRRFQMRHGLESDGIIGPTTVARLRQSLSTHVRRLELTLERWRWLPRDWGEVPPIIVNIPAFRLYAFESIRDREAEMLSMDVVVGQAYNHKTPVFSASLQHMIFSPYWEVPPSIARKELLPLARRDPDYLERHHFEILSGANRQLPVSTASLNAVAAGRARIRQRPGKDNALGGVKFVFPNAFNVYMHDTPTQSAFTLARRDLSYGCVRLAKPRELAQFLLRDQPEWDSTAIENAMRRGTPQTVALSRAVPVFILYGTAAVREDGTVLFYDDIYGHDRALSRMLSAGYPYENARALR